MMQIQNQSTYKRVSKTARYVSLSVVIMLFGMAVAPAFAQSSTAALGSAKATQTKSTYKFKAGKDISSGYFIHTSTVGGDMYKEKIGVTCDSTASTKPYFTISYQYTSRVAGHTDTTTKQQATIYSAKRVNQVCQLTKNGVLVVRPSAVKQPKASFKYLFNIARQKHILPFD